jgi:nucleoside-diphosphate-sugar epimerase
MNWKKQKVLVTGGASFIGSHLVDRLVDLGAEVRVTDNFMSGKKENVEKHLKHKNIELIDENLLDSKITQTSCKNRSIVFHLACDHGGRGYVDLHQAACSTNLTLDGMVFLAAFKAGVEKIVYASSGCVYPNFLQTDSQKILYLKEDQVKPPYDSDNMYGWAKLMGELTLKAFYHDWGIKTASCRYFTVYGERGKENHAVIAMIAKAFVKQNPYLVWGDGNQIRNWTYVGDIIDGTILAAEKIDDGTAVNLGTMERIRVIDAVKETLKYTHFSPKIVFQKEMPVGPVNRVADNHLANKLLGWQPKMKFVDGLRRTIDWYFSHKDRSVVWDIVTHKLTER